MSQEIKNKKTSRTTKTVKNTAFSLMSQLLETLLSFVLRSTFIRYLGDQYTGVASVFTTILTMLSLSELGFGTAIATALYKPLKERNMLLIQQLMDFYKKAYRIIAAFILLVGLMLIPFLQYIIKDVPDIKESIALIYVLYIIKTSASYLMIYKTTLLRADQKIFVVKKMEMMCKLARYFIEIMIIFIFRMYIVYLIIEVMATLLQNYIITRRAENEYPDAFKKPAASLPKKTVASLLKDVKGLSMYKLSGTIGNSIDTMLISSYISTPTVALVGNYTHIKNHLQTMLMQFYTSVIPSVGNLVAENNERQKDVFDRLFYISFLIVNFCSISMFVISKPFIQLWLGDHYILGNDIAFVIAFDFFLYILLQAIASFRTANGLFVKGQYRPLITAILNIIVSINLIQRFGIIGTLCSTVIVRILTQWYDPYLLYKYIFKSSFMKFYAKYIWYILIFISGAFLTNYVFKLIAPENAFFGLAVSSVTCIIFPNFWALLWTANTKEFTYVHKLFRTLIKRISQRIKIFGI